MNQYVIGYGGGRGEQEWHAEVVVPAESLRAALDGFEAKSPEFTVYSVEQVE